MASVSLAAAGCDEPAPPAPTSPAAHRAAQWRSRAGISNDGGRSIEPALATDGADRAVLVWSDDTSGRFQIYARAFSGTAWEELGSGSATGDGLSSTLSPSRAPSVALMADGNPIVAWVDGVDTGRQIYVRRFDGTTWREAGLGSSSGQGVSATGAASVAPCLVVDANDIPIVFWEERRPTGYRIYAKQLVGNAWIEATQDSAIGDGLSGPGVEGLAPTAAVGTSGLLAFAWEGRQAGGANILVGGRAGTSWGVLTSDPWGSGGLNEGSLAARAPTVHVDATDRVSVAWREEVSVGLGQIYLKRFEGGAWTELDGSASGGGLSATAGDSDHPVVFQDGSAPSVFWLDSSGGRFQVYGKEYSSVSGWHTLALGSDSGDGLSRAPGTVGHVAAALYDGSGVVAAWTDDASGPEEVLVDLSARSLWRPLGEPWGGPKAASFGAAGDAVVTPTGRIYRAIPVQRAVTGQCGLRVQVFDGERWLETATPDVAEVACNPAHADLALDVGGRPVVAWVAPTSPTQIYVRRFDGSAWQSLGAGSDSGGGVSNTAGTSKEPVLSGNALGELVLGWRDDTSGTYQVYVRRFEGGAWVEVPAGSASAGGVTAANPSSFDLAVGPAGDPVLVWDEGIVGIWMRRFEGTGWVPVGAGSDSGTGVAHVSSASEPALVLDGTGTPHVSYLSSGVYVRRLEGSTWVDVGGDPPGPVDIFEGQGPLAKATDIVITAGGAPIVARIHDLGQAVLRFDVDRWREMGIGSGMTAVSTRGLLRFDGTSRLLLGADGMRPLVASTSSVTGADFHAYASDYSSPMAVPTIMRLFDNERTPDTQPTFVFSATHERGLELDYEVQWAMDRDMVGGISRVSSTATEFSALDGGGGPPFASGERVAYVVPATDTFPDGTTFWWRVRAIESGTGLAGPFSAARSATVNTASAVPSWYQTTAEQFVTGALADARALSPEDVVVPTYPGGASQTDQRSPSLTLSGTFATPGAAFAKDGACASSPDNTDALVVYGGFPFALPDGLTIEGIDIGLNAYKTGGRTVTVTVDLSNDGGQSFGAAAAQEITQVADPQGDLIITGTPDPLWGLNWSPAAVGTDSLAVRVAVTVSGGGSQTGLCLDHLWARIHYSGSVAGVITSPLITFSSFPGATAWGVARWDQSLVAGSVTYEVLDGSGASMLAVGGSSSGTVMLDLSGTSPASLPSIRLRATLDAAGSGGVTSMNWWEVTTTAVGNVAPQVIGVTASPTAVLLPGIATATLTCTFSDANASPADTFVLSISVRQPDNSTIVPICNAVSSLGACFRGAVLSVSGTNPYTAIVQWDPPDDLPIGLYDLGCEVVDLSGAGETGALRVDDILTLACFDSDATCDGVDDDCDGATDEEYQPIPTTCGVGPCAGNTGDLTCVAGTAQDSCDPLAGAALVDNSCDGVDEDCDGATDDDYPTFATSCGVGVCAANTGVSSCAGGQVVDTCDPLAGASTDDGSCNGLDDDCDAGTDEDYVVDSGCGLGYCRDANQASICAGGTETPCAPAAPLATTDVTCDGVDEDCDGWIDEEVDLRVACPAPVTACERAVCSPVAGGCEVSRRSSCCLVLGDCAAPSNCIHGSCPGAGADCQWDYPADCCRSDGDCDDGDACTTDHCDVETGRCAPSPIAGCCASNLDCDDGDPCSYDVCTADARCTHRPTSCATPGPCGGNVDCVYSDLVFARGSHSPREVVVDADASPTGVLQLEISTRGLPVTVASLRFVVAGASGPFLDAYAATLALYRDTDGDGAIDADALAVGSAPLVYADGRATAELSGLPIALTPATTEHYLVTVGRDVRTNDASVVVLMVLLALGAVLGAQRDRLPILLAVLLLAATATALACGRTGFSRHTPILVSLESAADVGATTTAGGALWLRGLPVDSDPVTLVW